MSLTIVRAEPSQATELTELAYAAKAYWGYPENWLELWRERGALDVSATFIAQHPTFAAFYNDECVGFYSLILQGNKVVLEHLFVNPSSIGKGVGNFSFNMSKSRRNNWVQSSPTWKMTSMPKIFMSIWV